MTDLQTDTHTGYCYTCTIKADEHIQSDTHTERPLLHLDY